MIQDKTMSYETRAENYDIANRIEISSRHFSDVLGMSLDLALDIKNVTIEFQIMYYKT